MDQWSHSFNNLLINFIDIISENLSYKISWILEKLLLGLLKESFGINFLCLIVKVPVWGLKLQHDVHDFKHLNGGLVWNLNVLQIFIILHINTFDRLNHLFEGRDLLFSWCISFISKLFCLCLKSLCFCFLNVYDLLQLHWLLVQLLKHFLLLGIHSWFRWLWCFDTTELHIWQAFDLCFKSLDMWVFQCKSLLKLNLSFMGFKFPIFDLLL